MSFKDYEYKRPNIEELKEKFTVALEKFDNAKTVEEQKQVIHSINEIRNDFGTMGNLCYIRHSVDTTDTFYKEEQDFFDEFSPVVQGYGTKYYKALINSPFREELEAYYGKQLFALAECDLKTYSDEVVKDLQLENKLSSQYTQLLASAKIDFAGEERTLSQLIPFMQGKERSERKAASEAYYGFLAGNEEELDRIYDELVRWCLHEVQPQRNSSQGNSPSKSRRGFCITCGNATKPFQFQKGIFNKMSQFVKMFIILTLFVSIFSRWNNRIHSLFFGKANNFIRIITFISYKIFCLQSCNQMDSFCKIRHFSTSNHEFYRVSISFYN